MDKQIWADTYRRDLNADQLIPFGEEVARELTSKICGEHGIIAKHLSTETEGKPYLQFNTYEAALKYHEFNAQFTHTSFLNAMEALQCASRNEPKSGLVWSFLARLYAINYSLELFEVDTPIDRAVEFAQNGVKLDPASQQTRIALAYALMLADEVQAARSEVDRALALNPDSLIFQDNIGYLLTLLGDWQRGTALIKEVININPHYNIAVHHALWLDMFRKKDYQEAYMESLNVRLPNLFWDHLIKAATLGLLGRVREGRKASDKLLELKPDFARRGNVLIRHFVKFDEIVERLIAGLALVGVDII